MFSRGLRAASLKPVILTVLADQEAYGYEIVQRIRRLSEGKMRWSNGTVYPLLHDLENKGLVTSYWRPSPTAPRRKYYKLTKKGEKALAREKAEWMDVNALLMKMWNVDLANE